MKKQQFKICIVTGCSSGLGLEILNKISCSHKNMLIYGLAKNKKKLEKQKKSLKLQKKKKYFFKISWYFKRDKGKKIH